MQFHIQINTDKIEVRGDGRQVFEVLEGETIELLPGGLAVTQLDGAPAQLDGAIITPSAIGASRYRVTNADGSAGELRLFTFEQRCLDFIGGAIGLGPSAGRVDTTQRRRQIIRSIVTHGPSWFTGTASSLANQNLSLFGA